MNAIKKIFTMRMALTVLTLAYGGSMLLLTLGIVPSWVVWLQLLCGAVFVLFAGSYYSLLFIVINMPFFAALPNSRFETLQLWRLLLAEAGIVFLVSNWRSLLGKKLNFFSWDPLLGAFGLIALLSLLYARFPVPGIKQVLLWGNLYVAYVMVSAGVTTKKQLLGLLKAAAASLAIYGFLGYVQLVFTFFTPLNEFWVYWASFVSKLYYGQSFSSVLLYSNSWFSYTGRAVDLRMFSVLPDSHSFAALMVFCIGFLLCLTYLYDRKTITAARRHTGLNKDISLVDDENKILGQKVNYWLWSAVRFAGLAIVLSGTRAFWVGLVVPFFLVSLAWYKNFIKPLAKKMFWPYVIIVLFFILSPFINKGLHILQVNKFEENFISRAASIYDFNDGANISRMVIWKASLQYAVTHPWGVGAGNFIVSLSEHIGPHATYQQVSEARNSRFNLPQKFVTAHNLFLHVLVETGFFGLCAFMAFWGIYFYQVDRFMKSRRFDNNIFVFFVVQTAAAFCWMLAAALFDVTFFNDKVLFYFFLSLAMSGIIMKRYDSLKNEPA